MINITNFFALFLILLSINIAQSCLQLWSNHCSSHNDCCGATTWCDTQGGSWAYGVCKPGGKRVVADFLRKSSKLVDKTCLNLNEECQADDDCCGESTYCDDTDGDYSNAVCRENHDDKRKKSQKTCLGLWSNHCTSSMECCGATTWCDTQGGSWAYGVCKPGGKRVVANLVKSSKLTSKTCYLVNDQGCREDDECCGETTFCDRSGPESQIQQVSAESIRGVCRFYVKKSLDVNRKGEKLSSKTCYGLWSNHCTSSADCCGATTWCDTNGGSWAYGVCKPGGKRVVQTNEELRSTNTFPSSSTVPTTKTQKL
jgi:hypothetical protein